MSAVNSHQDAGRRAWRRDRIRLLQEELNDLLREEALDGAGSNDIDSVNAECEALLAQGLIVSAVKVYRNKTGLSLLEAKAVIEGMRDRVRITSTSSTAQARGDTP